MRTLKELYELLWEQIKDKMNLDEGLCNECFWMFSDKYEFDLITKDIRISMPKRIIGTYTSVFGWPEGKESTIERKQFVQRRIKELT